MGAQAFLQCEDDQDRRLTMEIGARGAAALLMIIMPLALGAYLIRRFRTGWGLFLVGAVTFIGSQIFHIPFNAYVLNPLLASIGFGADTGPGPTLAIAALLLGLSAGVFEEGARWLAYRFWIRKARTWPQGVVFGSGHGGAEALIAGLLALATLIQLIALRGQDLASIVPAEQLAAAQVQVDAYWATAGWVFFLSAIERASSLAVQITLAVIVLQAFLRPRGGLWLLAAIGWHALVDAVAVYAGFTTGLYAGSVTGTLITEAIIVCMAGISLVMLFRLRPAAESESVSPPAPPAHSGPVPGEAEDRANLEASRFNG
jgi:uncharacterized membrane protein YhfC